MLDFISFEKKFGKLVGSDFMNGYIILFVLLEMWKNKIFKDKIL